MSDGDGRALTVRVISPDRVGFDGRVVSLVAPAHDGEIGILRGHAPMTVLLGTGELRLRTVDGDVRRLRVSRGFLQVVDDVVSVLAEEVEQA